MTADDSRNTSLDRFQDLDETLAQPGDGPFREPRNEREREWLVEQRFIHGLLRQAHSADAAGREALVQNIVESLPDPVGTLHRPRFAAVWMTAAAALAIAFAFWVGSDDEDLPQVEAVAEAVEERLTTKADRRFDVAVTIRDGDGMVRRESGFQLTTREGRRFVLEGDGPLGPMQWGSDGETFWSSSTGPDGERSVRTGRRMRSPIGEATRLLDLEYLELGPLLHRLRRGFDLRGRPEPGGRIRLVFTRRPHEPGMEEPIMQQSGPDGPPPGRPGRRRLPPDGMDVPPPGGPMPRAATQRQWRRLEQARSRFLQRVEILADRQTKAVQELELTFGHPRGLRTKGVVLRALDPVEVGESFYQVPE